MAIEAELSDGRILEFPDGTDPSVIQATVKRVLASSQPAPQTTVLGGAKELFKGLVPGAVGLAESAAIGASAMLPEDMEKAAREKIKSVATAAKEPFTAAPGYEESVPRKLGEAIGSTLPFLAAGPFGLAGRATAAGLGVGAGAGEARTRAETEGATGEQRGTATALGTIPGAFEVFAPFRILGRLPDAVKAEGVVLARRALQAGGEEAAQEALSGFAQNLIARGIYKPEQALIEGLGEQAAYGGATGAIVQGLLDLAIGRRARGAQAPQEPAAPPAAPGPQLAPEAPAGTQGTLFTPEEMGKPVRAPKAPEEPVAAGVPAGQQDLGLDFQREYADLAQERERLKRQPQTPEVKARVNELTEQMALYTQSDIESIRAEKEAQAAAAAEDAATRERFPALAEAPDLLTQPDEVKARTQGELFPGEDLGEGVAQPKAPAAEETAEPGGPTPVPPYARTGPYQYKLPLRGGEVAQPLTLKDIEDTGIALSTTKGWFERNVVGKTQGEVQALVDKDPTLIDGPGKRAKILRELLAPRPAKFEETPRVQPTPAPTPAVEPRPEPRAGEPSVGVPSEPAPAKPAEPGVGVPPAAEAPVTPDGRGLVSTGQPAVPGATPQRTEPPAVAPQSPDVDSIKSFPVGPARITPTVIARDKPTYHETNAEGLEDLVRNDKQFEYAGVFVSDNPDLALGQGANTGVFIEFRPNSISGKVHSKLGTSPATGQEYKTDVVAPKAISVVTIKDPAAFKPGRMTARLLRAEFDKETLPDGSVQYTRKGVTATKALPITQAPEEAPAAVEVETAEQEAARKREAAEVKRQLDALEKAKPAAPKVEAAPAPQSAKPAPAAPAEEETPAPIQARPNPFAGINKAAAEARARLEAMGKPVQPQPRQPSWADERATGSQVVVYADEDVALVRALDGTQTPRYYGMDRRGYMVTTPVESIKDEKVFTAAQLRKLRAEARKAAADDAANAAKYPDGPFTGTREAVIGSESIDAKYVQYLNNLMQSLGLGNIRVFMYTDADVQGANGTEKYKLYGDTLPKIQRFRGKDMQGAVRPINADHTQYGMFIRPGRSEAYTLETISHEMGHIIEHNLLELADGPTRQALRAEYEAWLGKAKKMDVKEFMHSLRNREDVASQETLLEGQTGKGIAKDLPGFESYWASYGEWFADNVSRWATTNEKPLTITEKFFSKVAQKMRDLVALVTGRKYPPNKVVADFLNKMGPADFTAPENQSRVLTDKEDFSISVGTESLIDSMGPLEPAERTGLKALIPAFKGSMSPAEPNYAVKFRTQTADAAATIEHRLREQFDGAVRDKLGKLNPMGLYRQAQDYSKMLLEYMQVGAIAKEPATGLWKVKADPKVRPPVEVYALIDKWAAKNGYSRERGTQIASRILEGVRLDAMRTSNKKDGTSFLLHLKDPEIDQLVRGYKADPDLQAMSKAMDEARLAMVDNMVKVGRLTAEQGQVWKEAAGYVPFDRIEDFATSFNKIKKISNKGLAQIGKLPELVGSINRPVGNVFDNYLNTLGWMVGQTLKTDGTVRTLRSLEDAGHAKFLGRSTQQKENTVGMYVKGEMMYWELPSKYDVLAFKDLNPPKAKWLQILGQASNVLRKSVTILPPFALKQVTDDVQRAIMTSGVKNPGALLRMTLSNFGGLALAELRGIQHPTVKEFGALGLTGEYDFQQGKPATSVLKDLGYKPRGKFETLLHRLDGITRASDLAVRKAIYDQSMKETNDELLSQTRAREFINFRRRGASDFVGAMVTTIPFFNAYIQGMDVLYRAASGKDSSSSVGRAQARRMFWSRAAIAMTLSTLYALGKGDDDEDYNEMDLRIRDSNWILPGGFKLPVPGELGALFKVIPERIVEYMRRQGTPEEQEAWEATRTALSHIFEQYVGRVVPVPQAVKPLLEAWTNYSFFTGRELEGIYQRQQDPSMRRASNTSELAIAIANFSKDVVGVDKVSPIMIDNALNGYFGSTAGLLVAVTDSLLNPTRVDRPLHKYALISNYMYDPVGTRRMTEFYEEREKVGRANATLNELMKTDLDRAAEYAEKNADKLMLESAVNSTLEQLERTRAYKKYLNGKLAAEDMTPDEREAQIKEIRQMEVELTSWLREAKASIRQ